MKLLITTLSALALTVFFTQCKKGSSQQPTDNKVDTIKRGNYIIRTKYMCPDGKAFVLTSASNLEFIKWEPCTPEYVQSIKNDPSTPNTYIWTVGEALVGGQTVVDYVPDGVIGYIGARRVFSIYQKAADGTDWYLTTPGKGPHDDNTGLGIGLSYRATASYFSDEDLPNVVSSISYFSMTDSTGRLTVYGEPYWWYLSLPTDPDDVCDDYNSMPIWRSSYLCPNTTVIGNAWKSETCGISQLVLEKVD